MKYKLINNVSYIRNTFIALFGVLYAYTASAQERNFYINTLSIKKELSNVKTESELRNLRKTVPQDNSLPIVSIPFIDGSYKSFYVYASPIWEDVDAMKKEGINTYAGVSTENDGYSIRFSLSPSGFSGIIKSPSNYYIIEVFNKEKDLYTIYPLNSKKGFLCSPQKGVLKTELQKHLKEIRLSNSSAFSNGAQLRIYRMAAAATGEFTVNIGGGSRTTALEKITQIVNLLSSIYENEVSIRFSLISATTNKTIIFSSPSSDPFSPTGSASADESQNGFNLMASSSGSFANMLPYNTYDVGHTFHYDNNNYSGSGQAGPTPCINSEKASGWTQFGLNANVGLVVNTAAHEIGHQFGAQHSYNARGGTSESPTVCSDQWAASSAVEPGSGSTIMSYGGLCTSSGNYTLLGSISDSYFNVKSIEEILNSEGFSNAGTVNGCANVIPTNNSVPVANAGSDATIPVNTPFILVGNGTDNDANDILTYNWEQNDVATEDDKGAFGSTIAGKGGYLAVNSIQSAPLFRSYVPSTTGHTRTFPDMKYVLTNSNNGADNAGEDLPQVGRTLKFSLTVRDNKGGISSDDKVITVSGNIGPLAVSFPNGGEVLNAGDNITILWSVNNTNTLSSTVDIFLSIDGGSSFPIVLANSTTNDGQKTVTLPSNIASSTKCRIKISSTYSPTVVFFDASNSNFTINNSNCLATSNFICPTNTLSGQAGSSIFNLGLTNFLAQKIDNNQKTYSTAGKTNRQLYYYSDDTFVTCQDAGFQVSSIIIPLKVSKTGTYTISALTNTSTSRSFTIYTSTTFSCSSFVGSNSYNSGGGNYSRNNSQAITLNECTNYYLVIYLGSSTTPTMDVTITGPGDWIEDLSNSPGINYNYTYVAVSQNTNQIVALSNVANFTSLVGGTYMVYGLQYKSTINPSTFLNQTISQVYNSDNCVLFSNNYKILTISGVPCLSSRSLVSPTDDINSGNVVIQASSTFQMPLPNANISASNKILGSGTSVTYQAKSILLQTGFIADTGTIFRAEVGGCN